MIQTTKRQQQILLIIAQWGVLQSSDIHARLEATGVQVSAVTIKRELSEMVKIGVLTVSGVGRSTSYNLTSVGRLFLVVDPHVYCAIDPDKRYGLESYNFYLFSSIPEDLFSEAELQTLEQASDVYKTNIQNVPPTIAHKELERLIIELSWKSSRIEGNTYSLLDTERLIRDNTPAAGHDLKESTMILNHKDAFMFIREHAEEYKTLNRVNLEELHKILIKDLSIPHGLRSKPVGVAGSKYRPLDNAYQIQEAIEMLSRAVTQESNPYEKALTALLGISYIQPFVDGNKRTSRLMANAILLAYGLAPLSYRSVDEDEYKEAMLVFYELNSLVPFKKIFVTQYDFAARNYVI